MYYNTTSASGKELKKNVSKALSQTEKIRRIINQLERPFSPASILQVYEARFTQCPITSIRRSLDTLKKEGYICETGNKVKGLYGRKEIELIKNNNNERINKN